MIELELIEVSSKSELILISSIILSDGKEGVSVGVEVAFGNRDLVVQVDLLHQLLRIRVPYFNHIVCVQRAAEHQTFERVPVDTVDTITMARQLLAESGNLLHLLLPEIQNQALVL